MFSFVKREHHFEVRIDTVRLSKYPDRVVGILLAHVAFGYYGVGAAGTDVQVWRPTRRWALLAFDAAYWRGNKLLLAQRNARQKGSLRKLERIYGKAYCEAHFYLADR